MKNKKTARQSFGDPYECQKPWPDDCFCQCGGKGVVFTDDSLEKTLTDPAEGLEAIKAVAGKPSKKSHYKTAFFEAFPKSPSCFIRGEGYTVEEAEQKAFEKYQKILNCLTHEWDRKNRTDGYCYCTKCPLSGTFLEPLTKCHVCQVPTSRYTNKDDVHYCMDHYYQLTPEEAMGTEDYWGMTAEELQNSFVEDAAFYKIIKHFNPNISKENWEKAKDMFIQVQAHLNAHHNPLFGPATKTKKELHEIIMADLAGVAYAIRQKLNLL